MCVLAYVLPSGDVGSYAGVPSGARVGEEKRLVHGSCDDPLGFHVTMNDAQLADPCSADTRTESG